MTALLDEIAFEDRLDRLRLEAANRALLRALQAFAQPPRSHRLRTGWPRGFYAVRGSMLRSPALICAEHGAPDETSPVHA